MKWFWIFLVSYLAIYLAKMSGFIFPALIHYYFTDLLAIPITATLSMWFMRLLLQNRNLLLSRWQVTFIVIWFSVVFEIVLPLFMKRYTGDALDVLMYIAGGLFYWKMIRQPQGLAT